MPRALLSVTDKSDIAEFAGQLVALGFEILSTGGTAAALREANVPVTDVASVTGFPEMLDGRVKTLHPKIHGAILGDRTNASHVQQMAQAEIEPIEIVVVNLYAFEKTIASEHKLEDAIESIDIGGPAMIRAAAKNFANVTVVVDPGDYDRVTEAIRRGTLSDIRAALSAKAFRHTAYYDSVISRYLTQAAHETAYSELVTIGYRKNQGLRYGENPHQQGGVYADALAPKGIAAAVQLWGKELSYNNYLDADAAWELVGDMPAGSCAIIKHGNPCGAAIGSDLGDSYKQARETDPVSAFGGIAAFHGMVDVCAAKAMTEKGNFLEVVIAEKFSADAIQIFKDRAGWGQNVRLLEAALPSSERSVTVRTIKGGALLQDSDEDPGEQSWEVATERQPTAEEWQALRLAWRIVQHVKSNAIVVSSPERMLGVGAGQMNRVHSVRLALEQAGEAAKGAALASDAFFPFADSIEAAASSGISAVIQPGGSKKDEEVVAAANEKGIAMVFTKTRHFRH